MVDEALAEDDVAEEVPHEDIELLVHLDVAQGFDQLVHGARGLKGKQLALDVYISFFQSACLLIMGLVYKAIRIY